MFRREPITCNGFNMPIPEQEMPEAISQFAFSSHVAHEIKERDCWTCECGRSLHDDWMVDASHLDHNKNNPYYNNEQNGKCECLRCHIKRHIDLLFEADDKDWRFEDNSQFDWATRALQLLATRAYNKGLRTKEHYEDIPFDVCDDRDEVIEIFAENGLDANDFIL